LWRKAGWGVTIIPTWDESPGNHWPGRLIAAGCKIVNATQDTVASVSGIAGSTVVAFCNQFACRAWPAMHAVGCRLVYSPCMTYPTDPEREVFPTCPPTAAHFQSRFQAALLGPQYAAWGTKHQVVIPGAFDLDSFPFRPKDREHRFVVGRLARPEPTKWPRALWSILGDVRKHRIDLRALCMGWHADLSSKCGQPPAWAECLPTGSCSARHFLAQCDALLCMNGGDKENWPRVGLEAMAAGVPIVAERRWGWTEMLDDSTAALVETPLEATAALIRLATDDIYRQTLIVNAREKVERLTDPDVLGDMWTGALSSLS